MIVDLMMKRLKEQMGEHEAAIELTEEAKELLVDKGYDPAMGARPLRRAIQRFIEDPLADFVLGRSIKPGSTIVVGKKDDEEEVDISIVEGEAPPEPEKVTVPAEEPRRRRTATSLPPTTSRCTLIEYDDASPEVRAVYDDIMETRQTDWVNNFWKALAADPVALRRTWESVKEVMAPGALDPLTKELLYVAVSVTNGCEYCIASHSASARKKGMTEEQLAELLAVVGMANETNALAIGYGVPVDDAFRR